MRILFCNYEYPPLGGGGGVVMAALARELARRHEVTVITSRALDLPAESSEGGVKILRVPVFFRKAFAVANFPSMMAYVPTAITRGLLLRPGRSFDVINTHFVVPTGPVGHVLGKIGGVPNVLSVHGGDLFDPSKSLSPHRHGWLRAPIRRMLTKADLVVGQSRDTNRHVAEIYGVKRDVELIPLGIDRPPPAEADARQKLGLPASAFVMVTVGRVVPRKRSVQLIEALARSGLPDAHLVVVGDGPDVGAVRAAAQTAGIADRVHLLGMVSDAEKYRALAAADLFVSTSQHEGFGLVFLEAMAFGLPVVCYDRGGQTDFLRTGETGYVLKLNDLDAFVAALRQLHSDREGCRTLGERNRRRCEEFFIDRCAERYEALFESILRKPRAAQPVATP